MIPNDSWNDPWSDYVQSQKAGRPINNSANSLAGAGSQDIYTSGPSNNSRPYKRGDPVVSAGSFFTGCFAVAVAYFSGANPFWIFGSFFIGSFLGAIVLRVLKGLMSNGEAWAGLGFGIGVWLLIQLAIWIRKFVMGYANHSFPYNWVGGWYFYLFHGIGVIGSVIYGVFAWYWRLTPFQSNGWNITLSSALTILSAAAIYYPINHLWEWCAKRRLLKKLTIIGCSLAFGPAVIGLLWYFGALIVRWINS